jgi:hypothetical protein
MCFLNFLQRLGGVCQKSSRLRIPLLTIVYVSNLGGCKRNSTEFQFWSLPELRNEGETVVPAFEWSVCSGFQFAQGHEAYSVECTNLSRMWCGVSPNFGDSKRNFSEFQFWSLPELRNEGETIVPAFEWSVCSGFQFAQGHEAYSVECTNLPTSNVVWSKFRGL